MATKSRTLPLTKRGLNFEMLMWLFVRLSALAMYALILFGVIGALIMGARNQMSFADILRWGFMPNSTHVQSTNLQDLAPWSSFLWNFTATLLLLVGTAHGVYGLIAISDDYITSSGGRNTVRLIGIVMVIATSIIGAYVLWVL